ncbi:hypothetical protein [Tunturiibacter psychrotolerans]|uniref:hypothetical protein n=1 Tax=Tunturiibacter psychrotolerans TaxID=3069686 RepID=UPI003D2025E7
MALFDRWLNRHDSQGLTACQKLTKLGLKNFDGTLTAAEIAVLNDTASPFDLPSPEDTATRPEGPYDENTPRPKVRANFLSWLATAPEARPYIHARGLRVYSSTITGDLDLGEHLQLPALDFRRCTMTGTLRLEGSETRAVNIADCLLSKGIDADGVVVHGPVLLYRTQFDAEIRFINATIESNLECHGAKLNAENDALSLDNATIEGDVYLAEGFECHGEVRMLGTTIHKSVTCTGAKFLGQKDALALDKASIGGNLLLNGKLQSIGKIRLPNCHIRGDLIFIGAEVGEVLCHNMDLSGDLMWCGIRKTPATRLYLRGAHVRTLRDDEASWPADGRLDLNHLVYGDLILHEDLTEKQREEGALSDVPALKIERRIAWLKLQSATSRLQPQPWIQLGKHLEMVKNKAGAKHVLYQFRCLEAQDSWWLKRRARTAFAWLEEVPARVTYSIFLTLLVGTLIFAGANRSGAMISTARDKDGQPLASAALRRYPPFQPFIYTLENAVPLVKLGVDDKWTPDPAHAGTASFPQNSWVNWLGWFNYYWFLAASRWVIILLGWFQAAVLGAALTNRFKS